MTIEELLKDKSTKAKLKVQTIAACLQDGSLPTDELLANAEKAKDQDKGTCIEALELATKQNPGIADESVFTYVTKALSEKAPRIKWESAKVIGNIAHRFPAQLTKAINNLLINAEHDGTVVRWASAYALGEILKLKTKHNKELLPSIETLCEKEINNGVKKKYLDALKKTKK